MKPEHFSIEYKQIAMDIFLLKQNIDKVARKIKQYEARELDEIETLRLDIISNVLLLQTYIDNVKRISDKIGSTFATIENLLPPPKAGIRRFIFVDNIIHEVSLEEAANAEGLSIPEYLEKEQQELREENDDDE